ncbi:hypothetical protein [Endothiovibrio diazotrophicus]
MQIAMHSFRYYTRIFLALIGTAVTAVVYLISGLSRVFSVMHSGTVGYSVSYIIIVAIFLFALYEKLKRSALWKGVIMGMASGYLAGLVSYYISVLSMPDGVARLNNFMLLFGVDTFLFTLWGNLVLLCWAWSAVGFLVVSGLSKRL